MNTLHPTRRTALHGIVAGAALSATLPVWQRAGAAETPQGEALQSIDLLRHDQSRFRLPAMSNPLVVTALWGSFCTICRREIPDLARLPAKFAAGGVGLVFISHPDFWTADYAAATQMGFAEHAVTVPADTDPDLLSAAFDMQGETLAVPQSLIFARSVQGGGLALSFSQLGSMDWQDPALLDRLRHMLGRRSGFGATYIAG